MAVRALVGHGYQVLEAEHGRAALDLLDGRGERIDVVVTDVAMPGLSGRELAGELESRRAGVPVLFMSGYTGNDVVRRGLLEAGQPFLPKPFAPEELVRRVSELLLPTRAREPD